MVRFSDMLGGSGEPDDARAANSPYAALSDDRDADDEPETEPETESDDADDDEPEAEPAAAADRAPQPTVESPEDVLDRLTQYATSARAAEQVAPPDEDAPDGGPPPPVGDDFLPRSKGIERKPGRSRKRRP